MRTLWSALALSVAASAGLAGVSFTNSLGSEAGLGPDLEEADPVDAMRDIAYPGTGAQFGAAMAGNDGRNVIHTTMADYNASSFVAEVTADFSAGGRMFFGLGGGLVGTYGTPDWDVADTGWLELGPGGLANTFTYDLGGIGPNGPAGTGMAAVGNNIRVRMTYDAGAGTLTWAVDDAYAGGPFVADVTSGPLDISSLFSSGEDARVFIGGGSGALLSDFSVTVVPTPGTLALLGLGGVMGVRRRR